MTIDGKAIAAAVIAKLKERSAPKKFLAAILVDDDAASASFVGQKEKVARELGIDFRTARFPSNVGQATLVAEMEKLARDENCGGIVLQLPLPSHIDRDAVVAALPKEKDVDDLRDGNLVSSPAVGAAQEILKIENRKIENCRVAIVGMGFLVGRPIAEWLKGKAGELVTLDIGDDLAKIKNADVVILGVGKAGLVRSEMLKEGALVMDFGYSRGDEGTLHGDLNPQGAARVTYTPTPGGTGPILVAKLFENFYLLCGAV